MKNIFRLLLVLFVFTACNNSTLFEDSHELEDSKWNRFDTETFEVDVMDVGEYDIYISVIHDSSYAYGNFNIDVEVATPDEEKRAKAFTIPMRNAEQLFVGQAHEKGIEVFYLLHQAYSFRTPGKYTLTIDNVMPVFDLRGIREVGIEIRKAK